MKSITVILLLLVFHSFLIAQESSIIINPRHYVCYRTPIPLVIDGLLNEPAWRNAEWTEYFNDIEGNLKSEPKYRTRAKMLWDTNYLYISAFLEEPHVWATLTERESVIFYDPDFEVFIDPDGDTHHYLEFEMNAFNTQWDLLLLRPYRDELNSNVAIDHWSINGLKTAVYVHGTINDPSNTDSGWTVEIAIPMDALHELGAAGKYPREGDHFRINFSRVNWHTDIIEGKYVKKTRMVNGISKPLPEENWVWSPQGVIAMHQPETWGYLQFSSKVAGSGRDEFIQDPDRDVKWALRKLYYLQRAFCERKGTFAKDISELGLPGNWPDRQQSVPALYVNGDKYQASLGSVDKLHEWHISEDGRIWKTRLK